MYDPVAVHDEAKQETAPRATLGLVAGAGAEGSEAVLADQLVPVKVSSRPSVEFAVSL